MSLEKGTQMDRSAIEAVLPHRRPFMFLETVEIIEPGRIAQGTLTDLSHPDFDFLKGHFPLYLIVPGAIMMESLAELSGIALLSNFQVENEKIGILRRDEMDYLGLVRPGDKINLTVEITRFKMQIGKSSVKATNFKRYSNGQRNTQKMWNNCLCNDV